MSAGQLVAELAHLEVPKELQGWRSMIKSALKAMPIICKKENIFVEKFAVRMFETLEKYTIRSMLEGVLH